MIERILSATRSQVSHRVWVISDLQQSQPTVAEACLRTAVEDFQSLELACDQIWYLGDAVEGKNLAHLREMAEMQKGVFLKLGLPLRYVMGNHDFDYARWGNDPSGRPVLPFYEMVKTVPAWKTTEAFDRFYFLDDLGGYRLVFLSDHAAQDGRWVTTHGELFGEVETYPYGADAYLALRDEIAGCGRPVITIGHYGFAGGNRPSALLGRMLPLPANVRVHFYGHAHIGDKVWAKEHVYRKISTVDHQDVPQFDIASLENLRGNAIRSAILEMYEDGSLGVFFRVHDRKVWEECYVRS